MPGERTWLFAERPSETAGLPKTTTAQDARPRRAPRPGAEVRGNAANLHSLHGAAPPVIGLMCEPLFACLRVLAPSLP